MLEFYEKAAGLKEGGPYMAVTVLDGELCGAKLILAQQKVLWDSFLYNNNKQERQKREKQEQAFRLRREFMQEQASQLRRELMAAAAALPACGVFACSLGSVFCDTMSREKKLVICGAGHVSIPLIHMGRMLGYQVIVLDDRPKFADDARRAKAAQVICEPFAEGLSKVSGDSDTYFVIVTRGHRYDQTCLESIVKKEHAYIGMIGSKRRTAFVKEALLKNGADQTVMQSVHAPIGLDIGAQTPEEIAVAIMAQIIAVKNKKPCGGYPSELLEAILDQENRTQTNALATIIRRNGSAPREAGTKMLIRPDGSCVGTIGGGCAEADIQKKALRLLREGQTRPQLFPVDMTGTDAQEDGMVCGGSVDVLIEFIRKGD